MTHHGLCELMNAIGHEVWLPSHFCPVKQHKSKDPYNSRTRSINIIIIIIITTMETRRPVMLLPALLWLLPFSCSVSAVPARDGLIDPAMQPMFEEEVPNAVDPSFIFSPPRGKGTCYKVQMAQTVQKTGLIDGSGTKLDTPVWVSETTFA